MIQKSINFILTLIAIMVPLLIIPSSDDSNYNILKLIVLLVSGLALLILLLASYKSLTIDKKDILIFIFMGLVFISTFFSSDIKKSIFGEENRYEGLLMFASYVCIYLCSKKYFKHEKLSLILNIMFYVSMAIGILGITQKYTNCMSLYPIYNKGISSTFGNSNFFGSFISLVIPISIAVFILNGCKKSFLLSVILFFNLISSGTRSAWVAFFAVGLLGLIYLLKQKNKLYFKRVIILLIFFVVIIIYLFNGFGFSSKTVINSSIQSTNEPTEKVEQIKEDIQKIKEEGFSNEVGSSRFEIWKMTLKLISEKPILGCGPDNLWDGLVRNCPEEVYAYANRTWTGEDKAHNEFLHIGATLGLPALGCYILLIVLILFNKIRVCLYNKSYFIICLSIISYLVQAIFNISTIGVAPLFWMLLGLLDNENFIKKINEIFL